MGNVPKLRFKGFVGEYNSYQLNELGEYGKSYPFSRAYEGEGDVHHIHYGDIHIKLPTIISDSSVLPSITEKRDFQYVQVGDIVIADASEDYKDLGKAVCINDDSHKVISGLHTHRFSPYQKTAISDYLVRYMQTERYRRFIYRMGTGVSVLGLSKANLSKFKLNLPVLEEQKKISFFFNELENRIERQQEKIELLKEQKKGYMQKIFNRELRFKDENGKAFPDWKEIKLGDICKVSNGNSDVQDTVENGKYPFFDRSIEKRNLNEYHFNNEALIYSGEGSKFYPRYFKGKYGLHQRCYTLYNFEEDYLTKFFYYRMSMLDSNNYFLKVAVGTTVKSLRMENFHKYKLLVPSYREQEKIVSFLQLLDMELKENQFKYNCFISQKRGFMQQMFV